LIHFYKRIRRKADDRDNVPGLEFFRLLNGKGQELHSLKILY